MGVFLGRKDWLITWSYGGRNDKTGAKCPQNKQRFLQLCDFRESVPKCHPQDKHLQHKWSWEQKLFHYTDVSLNFPSFHIIYLPALGKKKCGKELHRIGRIGVLASKNLKANPCFGTARYDTGASRSASWSLRPPLAKAARLLNWMMKSCLKVKWVQVHILPGSEGRGAGSLHPPSSPHNAVCDLPPDQALPSSQRTTISNSLERMQVFSLALPQDLPRCHFSTKPTCNFIHEFMFQVILS